MTTTSLKQRWRDGETIVNRWLTIPASWTAEVMARAGLEKLRG